jgi:hypothetical protein
MGRGKPRLIDFDLGRVVTPCRIDGGLHGGFDEAMSTSSSSSSSSIVRLRGAARPGSAPAISIPPFEKRA